MNSELLFCCKFFQNRGFLSAVEAQSRVKLDYRNKIDTPLGMQSSRSHAEILTPQKIQQPKSDAPVLTRVSSNSYSNLTDTPSPQVGKVIYFDNTEKIG